MAHILALRNSYTRDSKLKESECTVPNYQRKEQFTNQEVALVSISYFNRSHLYTLIEYAHRCVRMLCSQDYVINVILLRRIVG